jgi:hypothetical protein
MVVSPLHLSARISSRFFVFEIPRDIGTRVHVYHGTYTCTYTSTMVHVYHGNVHYLKNDLKYKPARAPAPASLPFGRSQWSSAPAGSTGDRTMVPWYQWYTCTYTCTTLIAIPWYHAWYTRTTWYMCAMVIYHLPVVCRCHLRERRESSASTCTLRNVSSAVHDWNGFARICAMRLLVSAHL